MSFSRRDFLYTSAVALGAAAIGRPTLARAWQQQQAPAPAFTDIRRNVGFFTGRGGTIGYMVDAKGIVVVDSQFPDSAKVCLDGLNQRSNSRPVDRLINTHHHGDHSAGNIAFKGSARKVVAHANAAALIRSAAETTENLVPDSTFTEVWREEVGNEWVRAKYYGRAHTSGDAVITFERANVAHMGDLMFNRRVPVIDRANGALVANWATVLEAAAADHPNDTTFIFGHAGSGFPVTGSKANLMFFRDYLTALITHARAAVKAGQARDEYINSSPTLPGFDAFGAHNARTLGIVFDEASDG